MALKSERLTEPEFKKGDRVRVTFETKVLGRDDKVGCFCVRLDRGITDTFLSNARPHISVEKIEPPVETFKPGDVVRDKFVRDIRYLITADGGHVNLTSGEVHTCGIELTSEHYERVRLEEAPF